MNCLVKQRAITPQNEARDTEIALGIAATLMTLATQQGWGAKRLHRLNDQVYEFVQAELMPKAPRFSNSYIADLEYSFERLQGELLKRMEIEQRGGSIK